MVLFNIIYLSLFFACPVKNRYAMRYLHLTVFAVSHQHYLETLEDKADLSAILKAKNAEKMNKNSFSTITFLVHIGDSLKLSAKRRQPHVFTVHYRTSLSL